VKSSSPRPRRRRPPAPAAPLRRAARRGLGEAGVVEQASGASGATRREPCVAWSSIWSGAAVLSRRGQAAWTLQIEGRPVEPSAAHLRPPSASSSLPSFLLPPTSPWLGRKQGSGGPAISLAADGAQRPCGAGHWTHSCGPGPAEAGRPHPPHPFPPSAAPHPGLVSIA